VSEVVAGVQVKTRLWLGGLAAAGAVGAHHFGYLLVAPDPHERASLLAHSGHSQWRYVVALAFGLLVASLARIALERAGSARGWEWASARPHRSTVPGLVTRRRLYLSTGWRLYILQLFGFLMLEGLERVFAGASPLNLLAEPAVVVGLSLQVLFALLGALVLIAFLEIVDLVSELVSRFRSERLDAASLWFSTAVVWPRLRVAVGEGCVRGPPLRA
jgi:hypothetical protein